MRRLASFLVRNWPLKIGAVALATVLYAGVVLSENTREWPGQVPIDVLDPPQDAAVLTQLEPVTVIRYRAPLDVASRLTNGSFHAWVDLSGLEPQAGGEPIRAAVHLTAVDASVQIVDYAPKVVQLLVDPVITRQLGVSVDHGVVPSGLRIGPADVEPRTLEVRGASTRVASVRSATARVTIDDSGINVDQEVEVLPLDETGDVVPGVELTPDRVVVRIEVARELAFASVPVIPDVVGEVSTGHAITSVSVLPLSITISGEEATVERVTDIPTEPIDITGLTGTVERDVPLAPPDEVTINGSRTARVTIEIEPANGSRSFEVGVVPSGVDGALRYDVPVGSVLLTLVGPIAVLDSIDVAAIVAVVDVAGLGPGLAEVPVQVAPPEGTEIVSIDPAEIGVEITEPPPTPSPSPSPSPPEPTP